MSRLPDDSYLKFPFRVGPDGPETSGRAAHVREQIEQVLMTAPRERVFRPDFGAGVRQLVFEPNASPLWVVTQKRLSAALTDALQGEVDPETLDITVNGEGERMTILVSYTLARIGQREEHLIPVSGENLNG
jgi:phage baseplate assembly protein W